ncbi:MAG: hypothetical protein R3F02_06395 [Thiolinea sp.]
MKILLTSLTLLIPFTLAIACNSNPPTSADNTQNDPPAVNDAESCKQAGGDWVRGGLAGQYGCVYPATDAGKTCTDSDQCQYRCLARPEDQLEIGQKATGQCQADSSPFGCRTEIKNGMAEPTLCVD